MKGAEDVDTRKGIQFDDCDVVGSDPGAQRTPHYCCAALALAYGSPTGGGEGVIADSPHSRGACGWLLDPAG
ncbi:MAG: hypothetical protein SWK90_08190 [Chloroflexota bacterium]|nr:hypothetical protein [Chloroflexota bacterium]